MEEIKLLNRIIFDLLSVLFRNGYNGMIGMCVFLSLTTKHNCVSYVQPRVQEVWLTEAE